MKRPYPAARVHTLASVYTRKVCTDATYSAACGMRGRRYRRPRTRSGAAQGEGDRKWSSRAKLCARVHGSQAAWAVLAWDFVTWPLYLREVQSNGCIYHGVIPRVWGTARNCLIRQACEMRALMKFIRVDCCVCVWSVSYFTRSPTCTS